MDKLRFAMRFSQTTKVGFSIFQLLSLRLLVAAVCCGPLLTQADEVSFAETYTEKLVVDEEGFGEVIWSGSSTFKIIFPWNSAVNIDEITGNTLIDISIGSEFQFTRILDTADNYEEGARSARFRDIDSDNSGNQVDVLFIDVAWNTKTFTISGILRNFSSASEVNFFEARDHLGVAGPFEETLVASIAFGGFSTNHQVAVAGKNTITSKTTPSDEEPFLLNNVLLSGEADLPPNDSTKPTVSITSPAANGKISVPLMTGKAGDNVAVAEVFYRVGNGSFMLAEGTTNWTANFQAELGEGELEPQIILQPGTNTVDVYSVDTAGNESPVLRRTFFYAVLSELTVEISGEGSTTLTNQQRLELGKSYSITATPAPSWLFREWLGNTLNSANKTVSFTMETNLFLQANFVPNPFIPIKGIYNGLFTNIADAVHPATAGFLTLTLKDSGAYSGRISLDGARHSISGFFNLSGRADKTVLRRGKPSLNLILQLEMDGRLTGTIMQSNVTSALEAELAQSTTNSSKMKYTLLIPPGTDPATEPGGYGSGCASIDLKGKLQFKSVLGDGTRASQKTAVSQTGRWPLFVSLYRNKGVLLGWATFTNTPESDIEGNVTWVRLPGATGRFYTNGFSPISGALIGSTYVAPPRGMPVLNWINGSIEFSGGNLIAPLTNDIAVATNNKVVITSTNKATLSIALASGLLSGSFVNPDTGKSSSMKGALLQKQQWGAGVFLGTNQTGFFMIQPDPVIP
jgi:hypothetical protein